MNSRVSETTPTAQAHAIAGLTGYEDPDTLRWHAACVQSAQQLTGDSGRFAGTDQGRLARALDLAQHGAVTLSEDLDEYTAEVTSGKQTYTVDLAKQSCPCADFEKRRLPCKHLLAAEIHCGALCLYGLAEEPLNPPAVPVETPALEPAINTSLPAPAPTAAAWPTSEAPASMNVQIKVGNLQLMYTGRDTSDRALQDRMTRLLPWLAEVMAACEANYEARQKAAKQAEEQAKATPPPAPERPLQEEIAKAVQAAMLAQAAASRNGNGAAASSEAHAQRTAAQHANDPGWCHKHQVPMKWHDGNARGPGWFSHQLEDGRSYCKGR
jgi:SWIM zinc finger